jgi:hypothetical protein
MPKISLKEYRINRVEALMDEFYKASEYSKALACAGHSFMEIHKAQLIAGDIVNIIDDEGIMYLAEELYPEQKENMKNYLDIYREAQEGK